ncbi:MAG: GLPGLI family protein [Chitinophagaceae bacterium]
MKTILMAAAATLITLGAVAQVSEGKVVYERKANIWKSLPPEAEQMKAMIPEFQTSKMELAFREQQSLYMPFKTDDDNMPSGESVGGGGGGGFRTMRFGGGGDAETFKDYEKDTKVEIRELGPKKYLLDDSLKHYSWKLSPDTMTILGHLCHKATTVIKGGMMGQQRFNFGGSRNGGGGNRGGDSASRAPRVMPDQPAVAWYADDIPSPSGPDDFGGLPGLILYLNIDEGALVFTPLNFDTKAGTVKAPSGAKKISREEYRSMMEQQIGGMRRAGGGGDHQIIIRQ